MTDAEIVRVLAEKVFGGTLPQGTALRPSGFEMQYEGIRLWNPLTSDADCFAVLHKMAERGFSYHSSQNRAEEWTNVQFDSVGICFQIHEDGIGPDVLRRATCKAALGVEVGK